MRLAATRSTTSGGSAKAYAAACWVGLDALDQISLATPASRSRSPLSASGSRATPMRQPPTARFLLSAVVMTVRSGAYRVGHGKSVFWSKIRSR